MQLPMRQSCSCYCSFIGDKRWILHTGLQQQGWWRTTAGLLYPHWSWGVLSCKWKYRVSHFHYIIFIYIIILFLMINWMLRRGIDLELNLDVHIFFDIWPTVIMAQAQIASLVANPFWFWEKDEKWLEKTWLIYLIDFWNSYHNKPISLSRMCYFITTHPDRSALHRWIVLQYENWCVLLFLHFIL